MAHLSGRPFLRVVLSALALAAFSGSAFADARTLTISTGDGPRSAIVEAAPGTARPTIVVLHGAYVGAPLTRSSSRFAEEAKARGYNSVFPDGLGRVWIDGRIFRKGADDVAFLRALAGRLVADGVAAPGRIYLAGVSNGGFMTFRMMCEAPEAFAAFGAVIAGIGAQTGEACRPRNGLPLVMIAGTADPIVPYKGGGVGFSGRNGDVWGAERTAQLFATANRCGGPKSLSAPDGDSTATAITRIAWDCPGTPVVLYRVDNGGHQSFGGRALPQVVFGRTTQSFSAPAAILDFFDALPRGAK